MFDVGRPERSLGLVFGPLDRTDCEVEHVSQRPRRPVADPGAVRTELESADGQAFEEVFAEGEASEPEEVAEAIVFAASRDGSSVSEIDINNRSKFADDF